MADEDEFVVVGKVGRPRGVDGSMFITPLTDFPDRFADLKALYLNGRDGWELIELSSMQYISRRPVMKIRAVNTPEEAGRLTNRMLAVKRSEVVSLPEGTFYVFDIVGCAVISSKDGARIGTVVDVEKYPANDVYVIEMTDGSELQVPAVKQYIVGVDTASRTVTIDATGLRD